MRIDSIDKTFCCCGDLILPKIVCAEGPFSIQMCLELKVRIIGFVVLSCGKGDEMLLKATSRLQRILLRGIPIALLVCALGIILLSLSIELGVKKVCGAATREYPGEYPGDKVDALMMSVESDKYGYNAHRYSANNRAFWALGQLGDKRALPFLRKLLTDKPCDHETNLCQGEIKEAIVKLEGSGFNLPKSLWRDALNY